MNLDVETLAKLINIKNVILWQRNVIRLHLKHYNVSKSMICAKCGFADVTSVFKWRLTCVMKSILKM